MIQMKFTEYKAGVDTYQIATGLENIEDVSLWSDDVDDKKDFIKERSKKITEKDGAYKISAVVHPNRKYGRYTSIDTYSELKEVEKEMYSELGVINSQEVEKERVDIYIDTVKTFAEMEKLSTTITGLYALEKKAEKVWKNVDFWNEKVNGFNVKQRGYWLTIYDKNLESNGNHLFNTRIEFRFIKQGNSASLDGLKKMKELVELLDRLPNNLEAYEEKKADKLYKMYVEAVSKDEVSNFTAFVQANKDSIATSRMCELLYNKVGLKGSYANWMRKFKKKHEITFLSKSEIKSNLSEMKKAVKNYIKG